MEALILVLAEMIILPLTLMAGILVQAAVACVSALAALLESVFGITLEIGLKSKQPTAMSPETLEARRLKASRRLKFLKRLAWVTTGMFALVLGTALILNFFFFESTLRWGLARISKRTGVEIGFQSASGNLFRGRFVLRDATVVRRESATSTFDLRAEELRLDLSAIRVAPFSAKIEEVFVKGVKGEFHRVAVPDRLRPRKQYQVDHLRIEDVDVTVHDRTGEEEFRYRLAVSELDSRPLRSRFAVFDLLFRSNASGEIEGRPFAIRTEKLEHGRKTNWEVSALPVTFAGACFGGPFKWLNSGTMDVRVEDTWELDQNATIEMRWSFVLRNLSVATSTNTPVAGRLMAAAIQEYLRRNADQLDVSFSLSVNENQFEGAASAGAAGLWDAARDGFVRELAKRSGTDPAEVEQKIQTGIDKFKSYLDKRKEKP